MSSSLPSTSADPRPDAAVSRQGVDDPCTAGAIAQLDASLGQIDALVARLEPADYATPLEGIFGGSVGGHVRHCLDHVRVLAEVLEAAGDEGSGADERVAADYDTRARGTDVESDPAAARAELDGLRRRLIALGRTPADRPVSLSIMMSGDGLRFPMSSTVAREVAFVFSHTIHHQAMIGGMARHLGADVPAGFGRAPSTIADDEARACAR